VALGMGICPTEDTTLIFIVPAYAAFIGSIKVP